MNYSNILQIMMRSQAALSAFSRGDNSSVLTSLTTYYLLLTTYYSPITTHHIPLTTHH